MYAENFVYATPVQKAAEIIVAKLDGREIEDKVVFPGNLILRATTDL